MTTLLLLAIGLAAGVFAGMFGVGGGLIIVPALLFLLKMKEVEAIGTSLAALIPPVGLLGAAEYYQEWLHQRPLCRPGGAWVCSWGPISAPGS